MGSHKKRGTTFCANLWKSCECSRRAMPEGAKIEAPKVLRERKMSLDSVINNLLRFR